MRKKIEWIVLSFNYVDGAWPKRLDGVVRRESIFCVMGART